LENTRKPLTFTVTLPAEQRFKPRSTKMKQRNTLADRLFRLQAPRPYSSTLESIIMHVEGQIYGLDDLKQYYDWNAMRLYRTYGPKDVNIIELAKRQLLKHRLQYDRIVKARAMIQEQYVEMLFSCILTESIRHLKEDDFFDLGDSMNSTDELAGHPVKEIKQILYESGIWRKQMDKMKALELKQFNRLLSLTKTLTELQNHEGFDETKDKTQPSAFNSAAQLDMEDVIQRAVAHARHGL